MSGEGCSRAAASFESLYDVILPNIRWGVPEALAPTKEKDREMISIENYSNCDDARLNVCFLDRPKGMHKKTFERLRKAIFEAADEEEEAFRQALYAFAQGLKRRNRKARKTLAGKVPV